ncbi:hypothetical protein AMTRI_Chr13g122890 [Amborella trichopoda]
MGFILLFQGLLSCFPLHLLLFKVNCARLSTSMAPLVTIMDVEVERNVLLSNLINIPENYSRAWGRFTFSSPSMVATLKQCQNGLLIATIPDIPMAPPVLVMESSNSFEDELPPDATNWNVKAYKRGLVSDRVAQLLEIRLVEDGNTLDFRRRLLNFLKVFLSTPLLLVPQAP